MNIYSDLDSFIRNNKFGYHKALIKLFPEVATLMPSLPGKSTAEKLHRLIINSDPKCKHCGSSNVGFLEYTTGFRDYCSHKCQCLSDNNRNGYKALLNDAGRMQARLIKSKQTSITRYGEEHWHQTADGMKANSESNKKFYHEKFPREINGRSWKQYSRAARHLTNKVYLEHITKIDPNKIRSMEVVVDHIYSIRDGFDNNVALDIICHWSNLQMISKSYNSSKNFRSDKSLSDLYEDCYSASR